MNALLPSSGTTDFNPSFGDFILEAYSRIQVRPPSDKRSFHPGAHERESVVDLGVGQHRYAPPLQNRAAADPFVSWGRELHLALEHRGAARRVHPDLPDGPGAELRTHLCD